MVQRLLPKSRLNFCPSQKTPLTSTSLRAVTLETVAHHIQAAERAVGAYRASGHRLISAMQRREQASRPRRQ